MQGGIVHAGSRAAIASAELARQQLRGGHMPGWVKRGKPDLKHGSRVQHDKKWQTLENR